MEGASDPLPARLRTGLAAAAAVLCAAPILIGALLITGPSSGRTSAPLSLSPAGGRVTASSTLAKAPTFATALPPGHGALVALVRHTGEMRTRPYGPPIAPLSLHTPYGTPTVFWVEQRTGGWLGVASPQAGNHRLGWIPRPTVTLERVPWELKVSLGQRRLSVLDAGRVIARYPVAIGRLDAPTPTGRFAVTDRLVTGDPSGPYGCCILALSAESPHAIQGWTGGTRIAIHSTPDAASVGLPVSHGCLRVTLAAGRWLLGHIPLGTPTLISS